MIIFAANQLFGLALPIKAGRSWQIGLGVAAGILGGLSSIWSPPVAMYLLATNTSKERFIGATGFLFLSGCLPLGAGLFVSGLLSASVMLKSLLGLVVVLAGFQIGEALRGRISQDLFRRFVLFGFLVMGLRLVATSLI
ncbi:MAG TPA: sulfite exporter TauE/SafE family protein, partial [Alphaproteobacteria bacterium]|nr:sulfite exporter TauE/SafE family protein [Alphaproteobacteria bacterium]